MANNTTSTDVEMATDTTSTDVEMATDTTSTDVAIEPVVAPGDRNTYVGSERPHDPDNIVLCRCNGYTVACTRKGSVSVYSAMFVRKNIIEIEGNTMVFTTLNRYVILFSPTMGKLNVLDITTGGVLFDAFIILDEMTKQPQRLATSIESLNLQPNEKVATLIGAASDGVVLIVCMDEYILRIMLGDVTDLNPPMALLTTSMQAMMCDIHAEYVYVATDTALYRANIMIGIFEEIPTPFYAFDATSAALQVPATNDTPLDLSNMLAIVQDIIGTRDYSSVQKLTFKEHEQEKVLVSDFIRKIMVTSSMIVILTFKTVFMYNYTAPGAWRMFGPSEAFDIACHRNFIVGLYKGMQIHVYDNITDMTYVQNIDRPESFTLSKHNCRFSIRTTPDYLHVTNTREYSRMPVVEFVDVYEVTHTFMTTSLRKSIYLAEKNDNADDDDSGLP